MTKTSASPVVDSPSSNGGKRIHIRRLELYTDRFFKHSGADLRRAITAQVPDVETLHNHTDGGRYRSPPVRYAVCDGRPSIVGLGDGVSVVEDLYRSVRSLRVYHENYDISGKELFDTSERLRLSETRSVYRSLRPWVALNQANMKKYKDAHDEYEREAVLERVLVGNLLSLAKSMDYRVPGRVEATIIRHRPSRLVHKKTKLLGFRVLFSTNMIVPEWLGIGKLVSKGFGLCRKLT